MKKIYNNYQIEKRAFFLMLFASFVLSLFFCSCATDPVTGRPEIMLMTEQEEINLGIKTDKDIVKKYGLYSDKDVTNYVSEIGRRLASISHRPNLPYEFKILDTATVNAFAVPGGFVYMTRGILAYLNNEAELACVMGHEIGHITARHSAEQYSRAQLAQIGITLGSIVSPTFARFGEVAGLGIQMLFLSFSRDNEREADALAVEYASRAGYEASALAMFFETLERMHPTEDKSGLPSWFSTHPSPEDRITAVRSRALDWRERLGFSEYNTFENRYLKIIDGLVYGEDPREGYVDKGVFYHPLLRFQLVAPEDWRITNTREYVKFSGPQKDAAIMLALAQEKNPESAAQRFIGKSRAKVYATERNKVNGLPSILITGALRTDRGTLGIKAVFVELTGRVYEIVAFCAADRFRNYAHVFDRTIMSFGPLTDPSKLEIKPERVRIITVASAGSVGQVLSSIGVPRNRIEEFTLLNGRKSGDVVKQGTKLKVVQR